MEYHQEVLNRATGRLETKSIGEWLTVTEFGARHGVGPKRTRAILYHMGVLAQEGRRHRLPRYLVEAGIGLRHDNPASGYPFDVLSPKGQALISASWSETADDYDAECRRNVEVSAIRTALTSFRAKRLSPMDTRQEVYWMLDHFPDAMHQTIALAAEVSPALVSRFVAERRRRKRMLIDERDKPLDDARHWPWDKVVSSG